MCWSTGLFQMSTSDALSPSVCALRHHRTAVDAAAVVCPTCDRPLVYEQSRIAGVSERHRAQWDQYSCVICQYRHLTRMLSQSS